MANSSENMLRKVIEAPVEFIRGILGFFFGFKADKRAGQSVGRMRGRAG